MKRFITYWAPLALFMVSVFISSVVRMPKDMPLRNTYHLAAYFIMGLLWARALGMPLREERKAGLWFRVVILSTFISFIFGGIIEICQIFIPYRGPKFSDAAENGIGAFAGAFVYEWLRYLSTRLIKKIEQKLKA